MDIVNPGENYSKEKKLKAKKSLGQNFLIDETVLEDIALAAAPQEGEQIVEIGPGHGELTEYLLNNGAKVTAIEKDWRMVEILKNRKLKNLDIIEGDALQILPTLKLKKYKLVGNIPYYITGHLFRIISELKNKPEVIVFTIQKEVAERICAEGGKAGEMNILAASIQVWAEPEIIRVIGKQSFNPTPKVDSAIIRLTPHATPKNLEKYYELLHIIFKQPRKTVLNNLKDAVKNNLLDVDPEEFLNKVGIYPQIRPEDLTIEELAKLSKNL